MVGMGALDEAIAAAHQAEARWKECQAAVDQALAARKAAKGAVRDALAAASAEVTREAPRVAVSGRQGDTVVVVRLTPTTIVTRAGDVGENVWDRKTGRMRGGGSWRRPSVRGALPTAIESLDRWDLPGWRALVAAAKKAGVV